MKVERKVNKQNQEEIAITVTTEDATLLQTVALQFAENIANCQPHKSRMRRMAMLIDKVIYYAGHQKNTAPPVATETKSAR